MGGDWYIEVGENLRLNLLMELQPPASPLDMHRLAAKPLLGESSVHLQIVVACNAYTNDAPDEMKVRTGP